MTAVFISKSTRLTQNIAIKEIEAQAVLLSERLEISLQTLSFQISGLTHYSVLQEMVTEYASKGTFGEVAIGGENSLTHLQNLFSIIMAEYPEYTQMRLISISGNGQELLRLDRAGKELVVVPKGQLQQKGNEPYMQEGIKFFSMHQNEETQDDAHDHEVYFSEVSLNRENGIISEPRTATLRALAPIFSADGTLSAFVVINADYGKLLKRAFSSFKIDHTVFVFNENMDYFELDADKKTMSFEFHRDYASAIPPLLIEAQDVGAPRSLVADDELGVQARFSVNDSSLRFFSVLVAVDKNTLFQGVKELSSFGAVLSFALAFASLLVASVFADRLTRPLTQLTDAVSQARKGEGRFDFVLDRTDEIGILAREFQGLTESLFESEARMRSILDGVGEGIIVITPEGVITGTNPALDEVFGFEVGALEGQNISVLMPHSIAVKHDLFLENYKKSAKQKIDWVKREEIGLRQNGELFPLELTVNEAQRGGEKFYIGILRDISERKAVEKAKSEFLSTVSHELRTPLTSIMGALRLLGINLREGSNEQVRQLLEMASRSGAKLSELVEDIIDYASFSSSTIQFDFEDIELNALLDMVLDSSGAKAEHAGVLLRSEHSDEPLYVRADPKRLLQALNKLVSNAIKFSGPGQEVVLGAVKDMDKKSNTLFVQDCGIGISEVALEKMFDGFVQADSSDARKAEGVGLGLAIAKNIVVRHKGNIQINSQRGAGTTVSIHLPRK